MADALLDALCAGPVDPQDPRWRALVERFVRERLIPEVVRRWRRLREPPEPADAERALPALPEACVELVSQQYERLLTQGVPATYDARARQQGVPLERFLTKYGWWRCQQQAERGGGVADAEAADAEGEASALARVAASTPADDHRAEAEGALERQRVRLHPLPDKLTKPHLCGGLMLWPRLDGAQPEAQRLRAALLSAIDADGGRRAVLEAIRQDDAPVATPGAGEDEAIAAAHAYARWDWQRRIDDAWDELRRARAAGDTERLTKVRQEITRLGREFLLAPLPRAFIAAFFAVTDDNAYQLVTRYWRLIDGGRFILEDGPAPEAGEP